MADYSVVFVNPMVPVTYDEPGMEVLDGGGGFIIEVPQDYTEPPVPGDTTKPVVTFVSPAPGTTLEIDTQIVFDVTDNLDELQRVIVTLVNGSTGDVEVLWDGASFTPRYAAGSATANITNGLRFTAKRTGGWPANSTITVRTYAVDQDGNLEA